MSTGNENTQDMSKTILDLLVKIEVRLKALEADQQETRLRLAEIEKWVPISR